MREKIDKFFAQFDAFPATPTLRAKGQSQLSSLFTGVFSFLMTIGFTYLFIIKLIQVFTYQQISSNQTQQKLLSNQTQHPDLFFAVRVMYLPVDISKLLFLISYNITTNVTQFSAGTLVPCSLDQWEKLGDQYEQQFYQSQLDMFLCLPQPIAISNSFYRNDSTHIKITIQRCFQTYCLSDIQFNDTMQSNVVSIVNVYFLDASIRSSEKDPISYIINSDPQFSFTLDRGIFANIQMGSFTVTTDYGVFPWEQTEEVKGNFVYSSKDTSYTLQTDAITYATIYIYMNRFHISVERSVGKVDEMLSYAGGFFSLVISFFAIFLGSYNEYRYQLMVAEGIFRQDSDGNTIRQTDFHFFKYMKYAIFDWINSLCCTPQWKQSIVIDKARQQANNHIDVTNLFRKIQVIQSLFTNLMSNQVKDCISLIKPDSLQEVKNSRLILQYYDFIIGGRDRQVSKTLQQCRFYKGMYNKFVNNLEQGQFDGNQNQQIEPGINFNDLKDQNKVLKILQQRFPELAKLADQIQLQQQQNEQQKKKQQQQEEQEEQPLRIQKQLTTSFFKINPTIRQKVRNKIPIIILIRLYRRREKQNKERSLESSLDGSSNLQANLNINSNQNTITKFAGKKAKPNKVYYGQSQRSISSSSNIRK